MRVSSTWFIFLAGCLNLEIEGKPCRTDEGCPLPFYCVSGYCAITSAGNDLGMDNDASAATIYRYNPDIQNDLKALACTQSGCHNATATNKLKIDATTGREQQNYDAIITNGMVVSGNIYNSPLIVVPATGRTQMLSHVKTLAGAKLSSWESWVRGGAVF